MAIDWDAAASHSLLTQAMPIAAVYQQVFVEPSQVVAK